MFGYLLEEEEEEGPGDLVVVVLPSPSSPVTCVHSLGETKRQKGVEARQDNSYWTWMGGGVLPDWRLESQALAQFTSQTPL